MNYIADQGSYFHFLFPLGVGSFSNNHFIFVIAPRENCRGRREGRGKERRNGEELRRCFDTNMTDVNNMIL